LFFRYGDKDFSFTDCTSFILMRELKLREALTTDRHFLQAGFGIKPGWETTSGRVTSSAPSQQVPSSTFSFSSPTQRCSRAPRQMLFIDFLPGLPQPGEIYALSADFIFHSILAANWALEGNLPTGFESRYSGHLLISRNRRDKCVIQQENQVELTLKSTRRI
jgi:hypothetical protein